MNENQPKEIRETEEQLKADITLYINGITWASRQLLWAGKKEIVEHLCQLIANNFGHCYRKIERKQSLKKISK